MPDETHVLALQALGPYNFAASVSMAAKASFVEPLREVPTDAGPRRVLDLAFPLEGSWQPLAVRVSQDGDSVWAEVCGNPADVAHDEIRDQLRRIFALDVDGERFAQIGGEDDVVAGLQSRFPGLRPVQYPSPYECAARVIIQHRLSFRAAATIADRLATEHGTPVQVENRLLHAFPAPDRLAALTEMPGLAGRKVDQLRSLGEGAGGARLSSARLRALPHDEAMAFLQTFPGIGPFSAELILIRGAGHPDLFPRTEHSLHAAMRQTYDLPADSDLTRLETVANRWRPFRSWVGLLLRHTVE